MSSKTLYIIRGVPGSGKSTLAHQLTKNVVETDDFMMVDGEYKYDKDKVYACHKKCFNKVLDYMVHNVSPIAVANTFIKKKDYKPYVDLAKEFGYNVEIKVCKGEFKNIHNVPQDRVEQMKSKFQESINSLLEMNGDAGITEIIENKKQNVKFVTSPSQLLSILKSQNSGYRILYDKNLDMYMIGHEEEVIHQDMLEYAYKSGLYYNLEDFIDGLGGLQNYIEIGVDGGYDSQDNEIEPYLFYMIFDPYNEWKIGDDGYDKLYKLKFGNLLTRKCDIKDIPLYNLLVSKKEINESLYHAEMLKNGKMFEIYKNPTYNEFWDLMKYSKEKVLIGICGVGHDTNLYVWDAYYGGMHSDVLDKYIKSDDTINTHSFVQIYFRPKRDIEVYGLSLALNNIIEKYYGKEEDSHISLQSIFDDDDMGLLNETQEPKLNDNFWKWFNGSKIVDSEGNPQVCYHGSSNTFSIFDKELRGSKSGGEGSGVGFWFSTTPEYSKGFKHKMSVYLSIKNPKIFKSGNVSSEELKFEYDKYNNEKDSDEKYYIYQLIKGLSSRKDSYDHFLLDLYHSNNQSPIEQNFYGNLNDIVQLENKKQAYDNYVNKLKSEGYDGIIIVDTNYDKEKAGGKNTQIIAFEPNQIKSVDNNGNWSLEVDNINEEKEVIEERLFPELSDRKYNELLWFTSPNMTANAYTKFFGKEMIADRIPAKYLVTLSSNDISLKDLIEKHRKLYNAKQVKPIADYKDFNDFIIDLNRSKYLSRNDKSNIAKSGAKIIKSFGDWNLYDITTWEAAKKYGSGTTWCVTDSTSDDYFKRYTNRLPFNNYQTEEDMKKSNRRLLYLINPNTDRKMAISVLKRMDYDWYDDEIEFYNEEDEFFYTYSHSSNGSIALNDDIMEKISYSGDDWPNADIVEDYGVTEDFIMSVTQFIKDTYRMNKEQIVEDMEKLIRQKYKQLMNIKESANNSTNKSIDKEINEVLKLSGVK